MEGGGTFLQNSYKPSHDLSKSFIGPYRFSGKWPATLTKIIGEWDLHQFIGYFLIPLDPCSKFIFCRKRGHKVRQVPVCHAGDRQEVAQGQAGVRGGVQRLPGLHHKVQGGQHVKENCSSKNRHF